MDSFTTDTIFLNPFNQKKVVVFKYHSVSFVLKYSDCLKEFKELYKLYNASQPGKPIEGKYFNISWENRRKALELAISYMTKRVKKNDTVYLDQATFDSVNIGP